MPGTNIRLACAGLLALCAVAPVSAKILFVETFSTGTTPVASGNWDVYETGTDFRLEVDSAGQGAGDGLLTILGSGDGGSPAWGDVIYSKRSFPRGNNLRVSYRQWIRFGSNALSAVQGPWHNSNSGPQYANMEAGLDYTYSTFKWGEGIPPNAIQGGTNLTGINNNYGGNTKNGSLLIQATLGDVRGAKLDWFKTDPNLGSRPSATEKNTLGLTNDPDDNTRVTGSAANVYLGFGNFDSNVGSTYVDDIVVENDEVANPGGPTILFVGASRDWASANTKGYQSPGGDFKLRQYLEQIGYNVVFVDDQDSVTGDATGKAAVIISSTVGSGNVNTKFRDVAVPVITWENGLFDDMNISLTTGGTSAQTQVQIQQAANPIAGGLTGTVTVSGILENFRYTTPSGAATGAQIVASIPGQATQGSIITYESGSQMENGQVAPARRVAFFLGDFMASETLTPEGKKLFRNVVDWATGALVPVELSGFAAE